MTLSSRLRSARKAKDFEPAQVAERLKLTEGAVRHHENGTRVPKSETIAKYSRLYGVSMDWLMRGAGKGPNPDDIADFIDMIEDIPREERELAKAVLRPFTRTAKSTGKKG